MADGGDEILGWAEKHPYATGGIVLGVGVLALWYLGYFSGSGSSGSGQNDLAAAYYGAESAQALAGNQVQLATVQANAATLIAKYQSGAAVDIAKTQGATTLGVARSSNSSAVSIANTGAMYNYKTAVTTEAGATTRNLQDNQASVESNLQNNQASVESNLQNNQGQTEQVYYSTQAQANEVYNTQHTMELANNNALVLHLADLLIPAEFAAGQPTSQIQAPIGGVTNRVIGAGLLSPPYSDLAAAGYSPTQLANITGHA